MDRNIYGYVRVSTKEQNEARQVLALREYCVSEKNIYIDKVSGKILAIFESARKAAILLKLNHSHICECCLGKRYKTVGGFIWKYQERM